jgi:hypothetical protein
MKDAYYFSHDCNARNDIKILELRTIYGYEGYGIFWAIIEVLREQPKWNWRIDRINMLSLAISVDNKHLSDIIDTCIELKIFTVEDGYFSSPSLNRRMVKFEELRDKNAKNGKKGGRPKTQEKPNGFNSLNPNETQTKASKEKESKVKEIKEERDTTYTHEIPTIEQCRQVAQMSGHSPSFGEAYFYMRDSTDWLIPRGNSGQLYPINNWRSDYANCYNKGYLEKKQNNNEPEYKVVDGGVYT